MDESNSSRKTACGYPLKLTPQFVERVWGVPRDSEQISRLYPINPSAGTADRLQRIGEVWLTGNENRITNGAHAGKTLQELTAACGPSLLGDGSSANHPSGSPVFPLLVKFLFTTEKLSVQLHPQDSEARKQHSWGKTEMWHILHADPGARLAVGFRSDVPRAILKDAAKLRDAATTGEIEQMLAWQEVHAGETFFVPAGTVHAIGPGLSLCEIQQNSDITYRLYDYNRPGTDGKPRPLHIEQALEVMQAPRAGGLTAPVDLPKETRQRRLLAACPYFATELWEIADALEGPARVKQVPRFTEDDRGGRLEIWIALEGVAEFDAGGEPVTLRQGGVVVISSDIGPFSIRPLPHTVLLRTFPPDWEADVVAPLRAAGATPQQVRQVCFPISPAIEETA